MAFRSGPGAHLGKTGIGTFICRDVSALNIDIGEISLGIGRVYEEFAIVANAEQGFPDISYDLCSTVLLVMVTPQLSAARKPVLPGLPMCGNFVEQFTSETILGSGEISLLRCLIADSIY